MVTKKCSSCGKEVIKEYTEFNCPSCGRVKTIRCSSCRVLGTKYRCSECGFIGP